MSPIPDPHAAGTPSRGRTAVWVLVSLLIVAAGVVVAKTSSDSVAHWLRDRSFWVTPRRIVEAVLVLALVAAAVWLVGATERGRRALGAVAGLGRRLGDRLLRIPSAVTLTAIVVVASVTRIALGTVELLPRLLGDELVYTDLAKGIALRGVPTFRGDTSIAYSVLVPLLWAPGYVFAATGVGGYDAVKAVNAVVFALAAVPTYLLARRVASRGWALAASAFTAFAPWGAYTALALTESAFYIGFMLLALVVVRCLERPTPARQLVTLAALAALTLVRPQALALLGGVLAAYVLESAITGRARQLASTYWPTILALGVGAACAAVAGLAGLPLPGSKYNNLAEGDWNLVDAFTWTLWNVSTIGAAFGIVVLIAFPVALYALLRRSATTAERAVGSTAVGFTAALLLSVALISATPYSLDLLHERNLFYVAPLVFVCVFAWLPRGEGRTGRLALGSALAFFLLALTLSTEAIDRANNVDAPTGVALKEVAGLGFMRPGFWLAAGAVLAAIALLGGRSAALALAALVIGFVAVHAQTDYEARLDLQARRLDWVDRSLPGGDRALLLNVGLGPADASCSAAAELEQQNLVVWTEFLNTRVDRVALVGEPSTVDSIENPPLTVGEGGVLLKDGRPLDGGFVIVDSRQPIVGRPLARLDLRSLVPSAAGASLTLWSADAPLRIGAPMTPLPPRPDGRPC